MKRNFFASRIRSFFGLLTLLGVFFFQSGILFAAEPILSGFETTPPAPSSLKEGDLFSTSDEGFGEINYPDGTYFKFKGKTQGQIVSSGLRIKKGDLWLSFRKQNKVFKIETPTNILGVRGTQFSLKVMDNVLVVGLTEGMLEVSPKINGAKPFILTGGQTLEIISGKIDVHPIRPNDIDAWKGNTASSYQQVTTIDPPSAEPPQPPEIASPSTSNSGNKPIDPFKALQEADPSAH